MIRPESFLSSSGDLQELDVHRRSVCAVEVDPRDFDLQRRETIVFPDIASSTHC